MEYITRVFGSMPPGWGLPNSSHVFHRARPFGLIILADVSARLLIRRHRLRDLMHPATWADAAAMISFLAPLVGEPCRVPAHPAHLAAAA